MPAAVPADRPVLAPALAAAGDDKGGGLVAVLAEVVVGCTSAAVARFLVADGLAPLELLSVWDELAASV
jgi:hypothetical protein